MTNAVNTTNVVSGYSHHRSVRRVFSGIRARVGPATPVDIQWVLPDRVTPGGGGGPGLRRLCGRTEQPPPRGGPTRPRVGYVTCRILGGQQWPTCGGMAP